jgi:gas vesicle protein
MNDQIQVHGNTNIKYFLAGLLAGGFAGTVIMLLLAPQSGKKTRDQIQLKGIELRDQAIETVEGAATQVRQTAQQITGDVREKAEELQQRGHDMLDEQRERLSTFVEGKNKDIEVVT